MRSQAGELLEIKEFCINYVREMSTLFESQRVEKIEGTRVRSSEPFPFYEDMVKTLSSGLLGH